MLIDLANLLLREVESTLTIILDRHDVRQFFCQGPKALYDDGWPLRSFYIR
jgi:hypothetical protein